MKFLQRNKRIYPERSSLAFAPARSLVRNRFGHPASTSALGHHQTSPQADGTYPMNVFTCSSQNNMSSSFGRRSPFACTLAPGVKVATLVLDQLTKPTDLRNTLKDQFGLTLPTRWMASGILPTSDVAWMQTPVC